MPGKWDQAEYSALKSAIGAEVERRRRQQELSVEETARRAKIAVDGLRAIEEGTARLTVRQLYRLGLVLDAPLFALLSVSAEEPDPAESREFIDAYDKIKDPDLKNQISTLISTVATRLTKQDA